MIFVALNKEWVSWEAWQLHQAHEQCEAHLKKAKTVHQPWMDRRDGQLHSVNTSHTKAERAMWK